MSFAERVQQVNQEIGDAFERALAELRQNVVARVRVGTEEVLGRLAEVAPTLPAKFFGPEDFLPATERLGTEAREGALGELQRSLAALDRGRSQTEILTALLQESGYVASRSALLLVRGGELRGWGCHGMDAEAAIREVVFTPQEGTPWSRVVAGGPGERLQAVECAALCSRIEIPLPTAGVLVPMVLRDKTAAVLYADRTDDRPLLAEALQMLVYAAAQAIELLPFRERTSTLTLHPIAGSSAGTAPEAPAAPPAAEAPKSAPAAAAPVAPAAPVDSAPEPAAEPSLELPAELPELPADLPTTELPTAELPIAEPQPEFQSQFQVEAVEPPAIHAVPDSPQEPVSGRETVLLQRSAWAAPPEPAAAASEPPYAAPVASSPAAAPAGSAAGAVSLDSFEAARAHSAGAGTAEVHPPSDVHGPGWAFATSRVAAVAPNDEAIHEEARRLARLLVSEIKLYNEEQVEAGRRNRDLYERLRDDIDRSRQMYEERIDPRLVKATDYFYQELVRILAAGDAKVLGI